MRQYTNPTQRIDGPFSWFQVVAFSGTPTFSIEDQQAIQIFGFYTVPAKRRRPFKALQFTGTVTVICGEAWDELPPDKGIGTATLTGAIATGRKNTYLARVAIAPAATLTFFTASLFHLAAAVKRVEIVRYRFQFPNQTTIPAGLLTILFRRVTTFASVNNNTSVAGVGIKTSGSDSPAMETSLRGDAGATQLSYGAGVVVQESSTDTIAVAQSSYEREWKVMPSSQPLILHPGQSEAFDLQFNTAALTGVFNATVEFEITEE